MNRQPLKAITLHRPWAYAIAHLGKPVVNRVCPCSLRPGSLIAIHAGQKFDLSAMRSIQAITGTFDASLNPAEDPKGIVAIACFVGNVTAMDSPWFFGPIGWQLTDVVPINPVPCPGQQGLWNVPEDVLPAVRIAYATALKGASA